MKGQKKMNTRQLVLELKENGQDFEFYPTTKEMIEVIYKNSDGGDWLDIGCGSCNFQKYYNEIANKQNEIYERKLELHHKSYDYNCGKYGIEAPKPYEKPHYIINYYVIEKSKILLDKLDKDVICLGTDFNSTMLIDKPVTNIFCNPPYSEFENWATRIIQDGNCKNIFLIIPTRWKESEKIKKALEFSNSFAKVLDTKDFLHAERQARANVDIIHIWRKLESYRNLEEYNASAFAKWFDETFKMRDKKDFSDWELEKEKKQKINAKLVNCNISKAKMLVDLYNEEINTLFEHFKAIAGLDVDVLETIGISKKSVQEALKKKATGTKARYWEIALEELEEITERLTSKTRGKLFNNFEIMQKIDFTLENIYPMILWTLKNASNYYDEQLIDFFKNLSDEKNVKPYKSNQKLFENDGYRWNCEKKKNYVLDYRIIMSSPFQTDWRGRLENDFKYNQRNVLQDIFVIARNLGFEIGLCDMPNIFGEKYKVLYKNGNTFMEYRVYQNGNMHVKFDIEFTKALNVEVSRLLGWIRNAEDIKAEFPNEIAKGAEKYFKKNYTCIGSNLLLLGVNKG